MLAQASYAQSDITCPSYSRPSGMPETTLPSMLEPPIAHPGAFGGTVTCMLTAVEAGTHGLFTEVLPTDGSYSREIYYRYDGIEFYLGASGENDKQVAACLRDDTGGMVCDTDIFAGKGFKIIRVFDASLELRNVIILAIPGMGLFNAPDRADPTMRSEIIIYLPEIGQPVILPVVEDYIEDEITYGIFGQAGYNFMLAL